MEVSQDPSVTRSWRSLIVPKRTMSVPAITWGIWAIENLFVVNIVEGPFTEIAAISERSVWSFIDKEIRSFRIQSYTSLLELKDND